MNYHKYCSIGDIYLSTYTSVPKRPRKVPRKLVRALNSDLSRFKFDSLGSKILKFPEFNLDIRLARAQNVYPVTHCDVD